MSAGRIENLRAIQPGSLQPLLEEEQRNWRSRLHWDFSASAELVRRYVNVHALDGLVLLCGAEVTGYCYWVTEEHKALIGDLYVRDVWRGAASQGQLLDEAIQALRRSASLPALAIRRVESQLMQLANPEQLEWDEGERPLEFSRVFMLAPLEQRARWRAVSFGETARVVSWGAVWMESTAELVAAVYQGHVDSLINDQYRSPAGAARFLRNIIHFPGCGVFQSEASFVAIDESGDLLGGVIATRVAPETGHIAQICVRPDWQGRGLGYELLRRAMQALRQCGCDEVSLTVTESNEQALRLYRHMGFHSIHRFQALIWDEL
jgi:ribosomal protein S18 acetylase RimI-like enzyme